MTPKQECQVFLCKSDNFLDVSNSKLNINSPPKKNTTRIHKSNLLDIWISNIIYSLIRMVTITTHKVINHTIFFSVLQPVRGFLLVTDILYLSCSYLFSITNKNMRYEISVFNKFSYSKYSSNDDTIYLTHYSGSLDPGATRHFFSSSSPSSDWLLSLCI